MTEQQEPLRNSVRAVRGARTLSRESEFERLYRDSYEMVYNYVRYRMTGDAAAEDVVADAYLRAARAFDSFDSSRAKFHTWVIAIATNCMRDYWRRSRPSVVLDDLPDSVLSQPDETESYADRDLVDQLLSLLTAEERNLVVMKYREGYRNVEIASELGMNASTVSTKLANALAKMRSAVDR